MEAPAAPDLVRRDFTATAPDQLWVADITYVPTWEGWLFLAVVIDAFSRRCVGWSMRDDLQAELVVDALQHGGDPAPPAGRPRAPLRPRQPVRLASPSAPRYATPASWRRMGSRGDAYDNAAAESFFSTIKKELVYRHTFKSRNARSVDSWPPTAPGAPRSAPSPLHRPRPRTDDEQAKVEARRSSPSRWRASSACSRRSSTANQLKTALAVQNSIDRMFGDFAGERDELSDVDRFLEAMLGTD